MFVELGMFSHCRQYGQANRPFRSSCLPPLQSESKCEVFLMKISFHLYVKYN